MCAATSSQLKEALILFCRTEVVCEYLSFTRATSSVGEMRLAIGV